MAMHYLVGVVTYILLKITYPHVLCKRISKILGLVALRIINIWVENYMYDKKYSRQQTPYRIIAMGASRLHGCHDVSPLEKQTVLLALKTCFDKHLALIL